MRGRRRRQRLGVSIPEGGHALFTVQPETWWPHDRARPMAPAARERDSRTVKQVSIPVHGANPNRAPAAPCPAPRRQAPVDRPLAGFQPWAPRAATWGMQSSRQDAVRSPSRLIVRDRAGSNVPVPVADPGGGRMALFTVQPETPWPHDRARLMAKGAAREHDSRTVKQVTIPVHGATHNDAFGHPFLHCVPRRTATGVQPVPGSGALRAATRAMPGSRPGAAHGPTYAATPQRGTGCVTPAFQGVTQHAAPVTTRPCTAFRR